MPTVLGASPSPFVRKVRVALHEKGIAYDLEPVFPGAAPEGYEKISPLKKIPAYRDGEVTLCDSSVIIAYLERVHPAPALYPSEPYEFARALWFEEFADGGLTPITGGKIFFQKIVGPKFFQQTTDDAVVQAAIDEELPPHFDYLEGELKGDFIVGSTFTIGDIGLGTQFATLRLAGVTPDASRWPKLAAYAERMLARPSFEAAKGDEHQLLGIAA